MKKAILVVLVVAAFSQAKAQQLFNPKPADSLKNNLFEQYFKVQPQNQSLFTPQFNLNNTLAVLGTPGKSSPFDHMPIAVLQGDSKMPVVKLGGNYKMPVLKPGDGNVVVVPAPQKSTP